MSDGNKTNRRIEIGGILFLLAGPILWALHFLAIYGAQSTLCALGEPGLGILNSVNVAIIGATVVGVTVLGWLVIAPNALQRMMSDAQSSDTFIISVMRLLTLLSIVAIIWEGAAFSLLPACDQVR